MTVKNDIEVFIYNPRIFQKGKTFACKNYAYSKSKLNYIYNLGGPEWSCSFSRKKSYIKLKIEEKK